MIPQKAKEFLLKKKEEQDCFCLSVNDDFKIVEMTGNAALVGVDKPHLNQSIFDFLPGLITENFDTDFEIPFYNINSKLVCNLHFINQDCIKYVLLLDKSEIYQVTQKYQQFAHDDNISKNKFKRLVEELELAHNQLQQSNREKATLIAMLSHELGTPLTSILGYSEILLKNKKDYEKGLTIINRNAIYLQHMIENTLLFGKSEAGEMPIQINEVKVKDLFSQLRATMLPAAESKNLTLSVNFEGEDVINIDNARTQQVLINLLNNAVKYTQEGTIELKFNQEESFYIFSVIDTGIGVPNHLQETIFNPWERVEESSEKGSGIGLFISMNITKALGGELLLKNSSKVSGSNFQLILPALQKEKMQKPNESHSGKSVLVIDDDNDILELIEALLLPTQLKVYSALNYPEAEKYLQQQEIDLVLTDLNVGLVKASSFIEGIKSINDQLPVVLMTAMPSNNTKNNFRKLGFREIITKPLNSECLINSLLKHL